MSRGVGSNIMLLLATSALLSLSMGVSYPFLSEYIYSVTSSPLIAGMVASARSVVCVASLMLGGYLSDLVGRKRPIWIGTFLLGLSQLVYAWASTTFEFLAAALCEGFAYFYFPAFNAMMMDSAESSRLPRLFTLALIADHLPYTASPVLGGFLRDLYGLWGLRVGFLFGGVSMLILALVRQLFLTETLKGSLGPSGAWPSLWRGAVETFRCLDPAVKRLMVLRSLILLNGISMFYYFAVLYAVRYSGVVSFVGWGLITSLSSASYIAAVPLAGVAGRLRPAPLYAFLVFLEASTPLMFLSNLGVMMFVSMALLNLCGALTYAVERTILAQTTGQSIRGRAESLMSISYYISSALGPLIGGYLYSEDPPLMLLLSSALLVAGAPLSYMILKKQPRLG
ncbi:MAG: MFS transporter [Candidatus Bathyarchaeia archaeon]